MTTMTMMMTVMTMMTMMMIKKIKIIFFQPRFLKSSPVFYQYNLKKIKKRRKRI